MNFEGKVQGGMEGAGPVWPFGLKSGLIVVLAVAPARFALHFGFLHLSFHALL